MTQDSSSAIWDHRWREGKTAWDLGGPHRLTEKIFTRLEESKLLSPATDRVWSPGCGRAHDAAFLARRGYAAVGEDLVSLAIEAAAKIYGHLENLQLVVGDCLRRSETPGSFAAVFDRAMLCALDAPMRPAYIEACASRLRSGGVFVSIPFTKVVLPEGKLSGPPFAISREEVFDLFAERFKLLFWEDYLEPSHDDVIQGEAIMAWILR